MGAREAYVDKLKAQVKVWSAKIDALEARAEKVEAEARIEYHRQIDALRSKQKDFERKLEHLITAGEDAWEDLKDGTEKAWKEFEKAVDEAVTRLQGRAAGG